MQDRAYLQLVAIYSTKESYTSVVYHCYWEAISNYTVLAHLNIDRAVFGFVSTIPIRHLAYVRTFRAFCSSLISISKSYLKEAGHFIQLSAPVARLHGGMVFKISAGTSCTLYITVSAQWGCAKGKKNSPHPLPPQSTPTTSSTQESKQNDVSVISLGKTRQRQREKEIIFNTLFNHGELYAELIAHSWANWSL